MAKLNVDSYWVNGGSHYPIFLSDNGEASKFLIFDTLVKHQLVFAVAIGEIVEGLKGEVKKMSQDRKYKVSVKGKAND